MKKITGYNIVRFINQLPKNQIYNYVNPTTKGLIRIVDIELPNGPIFFKRWNPAKGGTEAMAQKESISTEMIWRLANSFFEGQPINVDRVFGASYNTRSVLEALLAYTPQFYFCYPGRIMDLAGHSSIEKGHKHLIWKPDEPHKNDVLAEMKTEVAISEIPISSAVYDSLFIPDTFENSNGMDIEASRRHTQIQIALYLIGLQLGFRTWIAQNDKGIKYNDRPLTEHNGIIRSLSDEKLVGTFNGAALAGAFIDCIWFEGELGMPAVMEVEHTTGVTSGLQRMLNFYNHIPRIATKYVIVAPDGDKELVIKESTKPAFQELDIRYFPYSAVEELYSLCQRRKLCGITSEFLDCFMEPAVIR